MLEQIKSNYASAELNLPLWKANLWFTVLWWMMLLDIADRNAVNAILPVLKKAFSLSDAQSGLVGGIIGLSIALLALPVATLVDRWSRRKMISIMVFVWSLATYFTGQAKGYGSLLAARLGVGTGEAGYNSAAYALLSAWYPQKVRGTIIGIFYTAIPLGSALGIMAAGAIAYKYGWRTCFGVLAVPGIILAILGWFMPDYKTVKENVDAKKASTPGIAETLKYILTSPSLLCVYLASASAVIALNTYGTWGPTFYVRTFGMNIKDAAYVVGIMGILTFPGSIFGGWLGDVFLKKYKKGRLMSAALNAILFGIFSTLSMLVAIKTKNFTAVVAFWCPASFFLCGVAPSLYGVTQDLSASFFRAMAFAFIPLCNQLLTGFWAPAFAGAVSDRFGLNIALLVITWMSVALILTFVYISGRFYERDDKRVSELGAYKLENEG